MPHEMRLGIIGLVHDHLWWYLDGVKGGAEARIVCAADAHDHLRDKLREILGLEPSALYGDYREMLDVEKPDACLVFLENSRHAEATEECARRGIHVMVEKPIAASLPDADRMLNAVEKAGVRLMVNYPPFHQASAGLGACRQIISRGDIGRVWLMRFAIGHSGPEEFCSREFLEWLLDPRRNGGGAVQDFGTYGAALFCWYFGKPDRISAVMGRFVKEHYKAEDHAIITVRYDRARIVGTIEGTWASRPGLFSLSIFGEKGSIFNGLDGGAYRITTPQSEAPQPLLFTESGKWEDKVLPYFVARLRDGKPFEGMTDPRVARDAQEIIDAAKVSAARGREVTLPL